MKPIVALLTDIKFSHTIFALPFALLGAVMAGTLNGSPDWSRFGLQLLVVIICMILARTSAMLANRRLDRHIDKTNPRTASRALPSGQVTPSTALFLNVTIDVLFIGSTSIFGLLWGNWIPLGLSVFVLLWLECYPLLKRFTWISHIYLGSALAISPVAAGIAIDPMLLKHLPIWLVSGAVLCWVAGFDIIYALQDVEVDRRDGNKSMPASLGEKPAMLISQLLHCVCVALLFGVAAYDQSFGWLFLIAVCLITILLIVEHLTVKKWGTTKIAITFFLINGIVSLVLGVAGVTDLLS